MSTRVQAILTVLWVLLLAAGAPASAQPIPFDTKPASGIASVPPAGIGAVPPAVGKGQAAGLERPLDPRCYAPGQMLCADKATDTLHYLVDGQPILVLDARFGDARGPGYATVEGEYRIYLKDANHVSSGYGAPMPYSMFFHQGQAIHYSYSFAEEGYAGASHGCINTRDLNATGWLYSQVPVGTRILIY